MYYEDLVKRLLTVLLEWPAQGWDFDDRSIAGFRKQLHGIHESIPEISWRTQSNDHETWHLLERGLDAVMCL